MEIKDILKQLKSIQPDADYTRRSRHALLHGRAFRGRARGGVIQFVVDTLAHGSAIALAGALILLIFAGFSTWNFLSPFEIKSLDPTSLRAEAEAIDIQIKLTNLAYPEVPRNETTTTPFSRAAAPRDLTKEVQREAEAMGIASASSSEEGAHPVTIEEALDRLAQ